MTSLSSSGISCLFAALACLFLASCSSPETRREEFQAKVGPPQPPLAGKSTYFEGKVSATVALNPALRPRPVPGENEGERARRRPPGGRMGGDGLFDEGRGPGGGEGRPMMGPGAAGGVRMNQPRQALTITLTNTSNAPLTLQIVDVVSSLGNFVPVPEKATLAPGESITLEPMRGALANLDELSLKLGLRAEGRNDQQVVTLRRVPGE